jgi:hypothetical protein
MARRELISNKIEKFNDKPKSYLVWKELFENMVKGVRISASERFSLLAEKGKSMENHLVKISPEKRKRTTAGRMV